MEELNNSLSHLISNAAHSLNLLMNQAFDQNNIDVSYEQLNVLSCLWDKDGVSQQEIAYATLKDKASVTRLLETMEKKDLIVRIEDKVDKRKKLIYLTHKSKQIQTKVLNIRNQSLTKATNKLTKSEIDLLQNKLSQIIKNCKQPR